jgi:hypothetical protein
MRGPGGERTEYAGACGSYSPAPTLVLYTKPLLSVELRSCE